MLLRYWDEHARDVASAPSIRAHLAHWTGFFKDSSVAEATSFQAITDFKTHLRKRGLATSGVNYVLASGKAAFQLAWKRGEPVQKVKTAWRKLRTRCDLDDAINTYSFRHTVARHLRAEGVPTWEVSAQLGHKLPNTTDRYAPFSPDYLNNSVRAINEIRVYF